METICTVFIRKSKQILKTSQSSSNHPNPQQYSKSFDSVSLAKQLIPFLLYSYKKHGTNWAKKIPSEDKIGKT